MVYHTHGLFVWICSTHVCLLQHDISYGQNSTSGRMHGAIGCLLRCRYEYEYQGQALRDCEQKCNGIYMTLQPIDFQEGYELVNY